MLVTLFGTPFICHQLGSLSDMGTPPTWEKGSHLPPGTTKAGNLRDSCYSVTAPTTKPDLGFFSSMLSPLKDARNVTGCTGMLDELVGPHTKPRNLSHPHNLLWKAVIHASLDTRFKGMQVMTYPTNIKQLRSYWLKSSPKRILGICTWINKVHSSLWLYSAPQEALI